MKSPKRSHMWTSHEIEQVYKLWDTSTKEELASEIGVEVGQINYIANQMRKEGLKLSRKTVQGKTRTLIREFKEKLNR